MIAANRTRRNGLHAAAATTKALGYRTLSGIIGALVESGRLIRTGDFLDRIGGHDLKDGQKSWFGRHVAKAYRAQHGRDPLRVWAQHRTGTHTRRDRSSRRTPQAGRRPAQAVQ